MKPLESTPSAGAAPRRWRVLWASLLLVLFCGLPWWQINGLPLLLVDLGGRQLFFVGHAVSSPQGGSLIAIAAALACALYLLTHLCGRLWCGLLCPQTLLGQLHTQLEKYTSPAAARVLWPAIATLVGLSFVGYFVPIRSLLLPPFEGWSLWSAFWCLFYAAATWANIAFLRSRVCTDLCPFARLQPWISDHHTPHVRYCAPRGEPRGPRPDTVTDIATRGRRQLDPQTAQDYVVRAANAAIAGPLPRFAHNRLGDCTDCGLCLSLCPIGLDIRNGLDARCLDCGLCIDACDTQMRTCGYATGLIARQAESTLMGEPHTVLRRRTVISALALLAATAAACWLA